MGGSEGREVISRSCRVTGGLWTFDLSQMGAMEGSGAQEGQDLTRVLMGPLWQLSREQAVGNKGGSQGTRLETTFIGPYKRARGTAVGWWPW